MKSKPLENEEQLVQKQFTNIKHFLDLEQLKQYITKASGILIFSFTIYIIYFLGLTGFTGTDEKVLGRMQDIIIKASGWILFIISYFRNSYKKEE